MRYFILLFLFFSLTGCTTTKEVHEAAVKHQRLLKLLRGASAPTPDVETDVWYTSWDEAERGASKIEEATR